MLYVDDVSFPIRTCVAGVSLFLRPSPPHVDVPAESVLLHDGDNVTTQQQGIGVNNSCVHTIGKLM